MGRFVSVVIPAYNEEDRIGPTLERVSGYLKDRFERHEIIVSDDGSRDGTVARVTELAGRLGNIRLITAERNRGKGNAVRAGALAACGDLVLMSDADLSTPIEEIEKLLSHIESGCQIAVGSRALSESDIIVRQPWHREMMGKTFNVFVQMLTFRGIRDTQCGFKLFTSDAARHVFSKSIIDGFSFDVEILFLAEKAGFRIKEVPVRWINSPNSRVNIATAPARMFADLFMIRMNWYLGKYRS